MLKIFKMRIMVLCFVLLLFITGCKNGFYIERQSRGYYYENGKKVHGWIKKDNDWYYSLEKDDTGLLINKKFYDKDNDAYYYFDEYGKMVTDSIIKGMYFGTDGKQVFNSIIEKNGKLYQIDQSGNVKSLPIYTFNSNAGYPINVYMDNDLPYDVYWDSRSGDVIVATIEEITLDVSRNNFTITTIARKRNESIVSVMDVVTCFLSMTDSKGVKSAIKVSDGFTGMKIGEKTYLNFNFSRSSFPLLGGDIFITFKGGY